MVLSWKAADKVSEFTRARYVLTGQFCETRPRTPVYSGKQLK